MSAFADWLLGIIKELFGAVWDFVVDLCIALVDLVLVALLALINLLPIPAFITGGLQGLLNAIPSDVWYFAMHFRLGECLAMFGAAYAFRLARKAVTLFQW